MASPSHTHASAESARTAGHKSCPRSWRLHEPNAMRRSPRWSSDVVVVAGSSPGMLTWSPLAAPATIARNARSPKTVRIVALRHGGTVMTILFSTRTEYTSRCATEYTSAVGEYRTVSGKVTGPWRRGMCPRRRWREKCARARSRHRPRPRAVECRGYSKELWSQQKAYLPPAPCISRLAPNARENGMFSRPRICLTRISRIDRMGQR